MKENMLGKIDGSKVLSLEIEGRGKIHYVSIEGKNYYFLIDLNNALGVSSAKSFNTRRSMMEKKGKIINDRILVTGVKKSGNPKKVIVSLDDFKEYCEYGKIYNYEYILKVLLFHEKGKLPFDNKGNNENDELASNDDRETNESNDAQTKAIGDILIEFNAMKKEIETLRIEINNLMNIDQKANDDLNRNVKEAINAIYGIMEQSKETNEYVSFDYSNTYSIPSIAKDKNITVDDCIKYLIDAGFIFKNDDDIYMIDSYKKYGKTFVKFDRSKKKNVKYVRLTNDGKYLAEDIISGIINQ